MVSRFAALGLLNFGTHAASHARLIAAGSVAPLVELAAGAPRADATPLAYDIESRRYACLALGNLALQDSSHPLLINSGIVPALVASLGVEEAVSERACDLWVCARVVV